MIKFYCDESYKKRIKEIKEYAEKHPYNFLNLDPYLQHSLYRPMIIMH